MALRLLDAGFSVETVSEGSGLSSNKYKEQQKG